MALGVSREGTRSRAIVPTSKPKYEKQERNWHQHDARGADESKSGLSVWTFDRHKKGGLNVSPFRGGPSDRGKPSRKPMEEHSQNAQATAECRLHFQGSPSRPSRLPGNCTRHLILDCCTSGCQSRVAVTQVRHARHDDRRSTYIFYIEATLVCMILVCTLQINWTTINGR